MTKKVEYGSDNFCMVTIGRNVSETRTKIDP